MSGIRSLFKLPIQAKEVNLFVYYNLTNSSKQVSSYMFKPFSVIMYKNIIDDTEIISLGVTKSSGGVKECKWASFKIHEKIMHSLKVKYI